MAAVIYCRISEDRSGQAAGVTRQLDDCRALATQRDLSVLNEHTDNDLSALKGGNRPGYATLIESVRAGQVDTVICWQTSRLWRNRRERAEAFDLFRERKVSVLAVKGPSLDLSTANGRMLAGMLGEFDTAESEVKAERVARAAKQRAHRGGNHGGRRSFGYSANGLELVPTEADAIRDACRDVLAGVPLGAVARALSAGGVRTATGKATWDPGVLRNVLIAPRIAGLSEYLGEVVGPGKWPAIVDEQDWRAVRAILLDPRRRSSTGNVPVGLLSGWAHCASCGGKIISSGRKGPTRRTPMYRCRPGCSNRRRELVDRFIGEVIIDRLSWPDAADLLIDEDAPDFAARQAEALTLRGRLDEAADQFAQGTIDAGQLGRISAKLRAQLADIEAKLSHVSRAPVLRELVEHAPDRGAVALAWEGLPLDRQRAVVQALCDVIFLPAVSGSRTFDPDRILILPR